MDAAMKKNRSKAVRLRWCVTMVALIATSCGTSVEERKLAREPATAPAPLRVGPVRQVTAEGENLKPFILARPGGGAYLAWARRDGERTKVLFAVARDEVNLSPPVQVSAEGMDLDLGAESGPQAAVGPDGAIHVVWNSGEWRDQTVRERRGGAPPRPSNLHIYLASSRDDGKTFSAPIKVNDDTGGAEHRFPTVAVDDEGVVHVAWLDKRKQTQAQSDFSRVYYAKSTDGGRTFSANVDATDGQDHGICHCCKLALAVQPHHGIFIAFRNDVDDVRDVWIVRSDKRGKNFGAPTPMEDTRWVIPGCPMNGPSLAFDRDDRLHAVWLTGGNVPGDPAVGPATEDSHKVLYRAFDPRKRSWSAPLFLATGSHPRLAVDTVGTAYVVWEQDGLQVAGLSASNAKLIQKIELSAPGIISNFPSLAVTRGGVLLAAWQQREADGRVQVCIASVTGSKRESALRR